MVRALKIATAYKMSLLLELAPFGIWRLSSPSEQLLCRVAAPRSVGFNALGHAASQVSRETSPFELSVAHKASVEARFQDYFRISGLGPHSWLQRTASHAASMSDKLPMHLP